LALKNFKNTRGDVGARGEFLKQSWRLQKILRLASIGFQLVGAYTLHRRELAPPRVLKNWPEVSRLL
jgi:hypothetical protein